MISRTTIGRSFGGLVRYQFEGHKGQAADKQAEVLAAVGVRADSAAHMIADFNRGRQLNPNLGKAVWHTSLSFNPDDAAKLDRGKMLAIAEDYVQGMGLDQTQYAIIRHHDRPGHEHLHIVANRVADDGHSINDGQNFYKSKQLLAELIQKHELTPPKGLRPAKQHPQALHGADLVKHQVREALAATLATAQDSKELRQRLQDQAIAFKIFRTKDGKPAGISFEKDGQTFKGSAMGRQYSIAGIGKQLAANQAAQQLTIDQAPPLTPAQRPPLVPVATSAVPSAPVSPVPAASAVELAPKWAAEHRAYTVEQQRQNAQIQVQNKLYEQGSAHLQGQQSAQGVSALWKILGGVPHELQLRLLGQVRRLDEHQEQVAKVARWQTDLEKEAGWLGLSATAREAREKLAILKQLKQEPGAVIEGKHAEFARQVAVAFGPAPRIGFEATTYQQPEKPVLSLAAYATQRAAEQLAQRQAAQQKPTAQQQKPRSPRLS